MSTSPGQAPYVKLSPASCGLFRTVHIAFTGSVDFRVPAPTLEKQDKHGRLGMEGPEAFGPGRPHGGGRGSLKGRGAIAPLLPFNSNQEREEVV